MAKSHRRSRAAALAAAGLAATATPAAAIQGGGKSTTTDHPYTMQIRSEAGEGGASEHVCGGTLIAPDKVPTAAHCVDAHCVDKEEGMPPVGYEVVGGRTDLRTTRGTVRQITSIRIYPKFDGTHYLYDAAVLTLAGPMPYKTLPVAGPKDAALFGSGRSATALGRGLTATGTFDSICRGDSSGPLVVGGKLVGITSTGNKFCNRDYPTGLFTPTSAILAGLGPPTG
ncbi:trypsin-like serine protease [Streptomyces sp. NBC_00237]|uniref:S1 family peptidase n=1 Tax=Streptomyces sp. NBC_00237 TaxID=2975687 RepID=UPI00224FA021|nr:trypsin-like serine protease [Streptomyces sp. NBC_00237]MCX5205873.1 trypsin-like serine protease [Streptomyces sp. NBC_00237]